ncbi:alpha/beta fold hydrolase [Nonomuraea sp. NPDC050556]|uniref:alpha/beta fold hydrolase n=1 Tax=Nonomuraea sp. NPDC050556 TaxID=3364369 RepID=UPI0037B48CE4
MTKKPDTVVLLHGLAGYGGEWTALANLLDQRTIAFDLPGHGSAERRPADVTHAGRVAATVDVIRALDAGPVVLVGQSLGGITALLTAAAHPELVERLVLVEASPGRPDDATHTDIEEWLASWPVPFASREEAVSFLGSEAWADGLSDDLRPRFDPDIMVAMITDHNLRPYWTEWSQVRCPILVVLGEKGIIPAEDVAEMRRTRPDAEIHVVPGAAHDVHLDNPQALHTLLTTWLNGPRSGPPQGR